LESDRTGIEIQGAADTGKKLLRLIAPRFPYINIYSHIAIPPLGLMYVGTAASLTGRYDVEIIDENNWRYDDHRALQAERPADAVGFYCGLSTTMLRVFELAGMYNEMGVLTIAGGGHVDVLPEEALRKGIDVVVRGEGEAALVELLDAHFSGEGFAGIPGLAYLGTDGEIVLNDARPPVADLDTLPDPDFSLLIDIRRPIKFVPISRTRGCNYRCEFCSVNSRMGPARFASPRKTLGHLEKLVADGRRFFFFVDDNFAQDRESVLSLCEGIAELKRKYRSKLDFTLQVRTQVARDPRMMEALQEAGAKVLCVGIESPIPEDLRNMRKGQNVDDVQADLRNLRRNGFLIHGMFIFGYPLREGNLRMPAKERIKRFKNFIRRAKIDTIQVLLTCPLPGTELRHRLQTQNRIYSTNDLGWEYYDGNFPLFEPDEPMSPEEVQESIKKIMGKFYQFKYMFMVGLNIFSFSTLIFYLHNIKSGWRRWYRPWRNNLARFGGWIILRRWLSEFKKDKFLQKLQEAKKHLKLNRLQENKITLNNKVP
jgi:radical SAM superfamily enzyme YgiQ (UPF0313 family)